MTSAESRLAAASKEIRVRVESSKKRLTTVRPRRVGSFLIGRSARRAQLARRCRGPGAASSRVRSAAESRWRFIGPLPSCRAAVGRSMVRHGVARRRSRSSSTRTRLGERGGQVLADVVGADRQLAVAAVDQHRELDRARAGRGRRARRARPGSCGRRRARRRRGRRRVPSMPPGGMSVRTSARAGLQPQVVAVHRDVERADRDVVRPRRRRSARRAGAASGTPRVGMPSRTRSSAPLLRSRISWAMRVRARAMSGASRTRRTACRTAGAAGVLRAGVIAPDLLLRLTGRVVKGCRSSGATVAARCGGPRTRRPTAAVDRAGARRVAAVGVR